MRRKRYTYEFVGILSCKEYSYNPEECYSEESYDLRCIKKEFHESYDLLVDDYIYTIIKLISKSKCNYITLSYFDAHKCTIRRIFKGDRVMANKSIAKIFEYKEGQRLNTESTYTLLKYVFHVLCYAILNNQSKLLRIEVEDTLRCFISVPFKLPTSTRTYQYDEVTLKCKFIKI